MAFPLGSHRSGHLDGIRRSDIKGRAREMRSTGLLILLVISLVPSLAHCERPDEEKSLGKTKEQIQLTLDQRLQKGSPPHEVLALLKSFKVDHSEYQKSARQIEAIVRDVQKNVPVTESIQIIFSFDETDKLKGYQLKSLFTGP